MTTMACERCRPRRHRLGVGLTQRVYLPDGSMIEQRAILCHACLDQAGVENRAAKRRLARIDDLPLLEFLFTAPPAREPIR